jgi:hypothetical protein
MRKRAVVVERSAAPERPLPHRSISFWLNCDRQNKAHRLRLFFSEITLANAWVEERASNPEYI